MCSAKHHGSRLRFTGILTIPVSSSAVSSTFRRRGLAGVHSRTKVSSSATDISEPGPDLASSNRTEWAYQTNKNHKKSPLLNLLTDPITEQSADLVITLVASCHYLPPARGYHPSHRTSPSFAQYQITWLREKSTSVNYKQVKYIDASYVSKMPNLRRMEGGA